MSLSLLKIGFRHANHTVKAKISVRQPCRWPCLLTLALALATTTRTSAIPMDFTVDDLGGGLFQYNLTLNDQFGDPLSGLNILHGFSVFGLDNTSVIGAPSGWNFFAPLPPLVDELNWFSLSSATDVPIGGSLGGFYFQSTTDPAALKPGDFGFDMISGKTGMQLTIPDQFNTGLLFTTCFIGLLAYGWHYPRSANKSAGIK